MFKRAIDAIKNFFSNPKIYKYRHIIIVSCLILFLSTASAVFYGLENSKDGKDNPIFEAIKKVTGKETSESKTNNEESDSTSIAQKTNSSTVTGNSESNVASDEENSSSESSSSSSESSSSSGSNSGSTSTPTSTQTSTETPEALSAIVAFYSDNQSDSDSDDENHARVVGYIMASGASAVLNAGDIMEDGTQDSMDRFANITSSLRASKSFYSAIGNNDRQVGDSSTPSQIYLDFFNYPNNELWYSVNIGNLHAVFLDSAFNGGSSAQQSWLESDLQSSASQDRMTVVIYHHPTFKSSISDKLISNHVDFAIAGHLHSYSHAEDGDIHYFNLSGQTSIGYILAYVYESYVTIKVYDASNQLIDSFNIENR